MRRHVRRYEKMIYDPQVIAAMMDTFDIAYIGLFDEEYPYVIPVSFGYEIKDNKMFIYMHSAPDGHKIDLFEKNPKVCVTFAKFLNFPHRPYKHQIHDYRSVMAFGTISKVDRKKETGKFKDAIQCMMKQYGRGPQQYDASAVPIIEIYAIECEWENVYGRSEQPVRTVEDVPFPDVFNLPLDDGEFDVVDLLTKK